MGNFLSNIHSSYPAGDVDDAQKWRDKASDEAKRKSDAFQRSQEAWRAGRKADAKALSNEGKQHAASMVQYNERAAAEIFAHYNPPPYGQTAAYLEQVDLHGLYVEEALKYAEKHILACRKVHRTTTVLITGRGNRSKDGLARIKPAIEAFLKKENLRAIADVPNQGCVTVEIDVPNNKAGWADSCFIM
ncbi:DUF1771-domain-containing protein [Rickenella mellea]|uniref:DUF1771-domain-containing protein n=1 Tax=Rickenella mellea TaxID=50990 RepID=A0A4Y7PKX4_9AGAM|nr:DUF1771-domain-containing protein [Rickenella mellea]